MAQTRGDPTRWREWSDFRAGLYELGTERNIPAGGLLQLKDAYPLPTGGLRAAMAFTTQPTGGLSTAGHKVLGFHVSPRTVNETSRAPFIYLAQAPDPASTSTGIDVFVSTGATVSTWNAVRSHNTIVVAQAYNPVTFASYFSTVSIAGTSGSGPRDFYLMPDLGAPGLGQGVYGISADGLTSTNVTGATPVIIAAHQDRLLGSQVSPPAFTYTDPGGTTFSGFQAVGPFIPGRVAWMGQNYPSDLVVLRSPRGIFSVQGTIPNVFVREAGINIVMGENAWGSPSPYGTIVPTAHQGIWLYTGGMSGKHLSPQIAGSPQMETTGYITAADSTFIGQVQYASDWLFTPNGYVYDFRTQAWFRVSLPSDNGFPFWGYDQPRSRMFAAGTVNGVSQVVMADLDESTMPRASRYTFELPVWDLDANNTVLREIMYYVQAYTPGCQIEATITWQPPGGAIQQTVVPAVTLTGDTHQIVKMTVGRSPGSLNASWLKIATTLSAPGGREAPTLERMRIGFVEGAPYPHT